MFVIGKRDMETGAVSVHVHRKGKSRRLAARRSHRRLLRQSRPEVLRPKRAASYFNYSSLHFTSKKVSPYTA